MKKIKSLKTFLILFDKDTKKVRRINEKKRIFFHCVDSLYYNFHKISLNRGGSNIDSLKWLKQKKATINQKNDDDKCFQYAITVALNREKIKSHPERTSNIKPLLIDMIGKKYIFHQIKKTGVSLKKIIKQYLLISYMYLIILKK